MENCSTKFCLLVILQVVPCGQYLNYPGALAGLWCLGAVASEQPDLVFSGKLLSPHSFNNKICQNLFLWHPLVDQLLHQDVVEPGPDGFPAVLGESQGLWHCLWVYLGLPSGCQIYLTHQVTSLHFYSSKIFIQSEIFLMIKDLYSSVIGNLSLALVTATMSFRIYKSVLAAVNKTQEGHPFKVSEAFILLQITKH